MSMAAVQVQIPTPSRLGVTFVQCSHRAASLPCVYCDAAHHDRRRRSSRAGAEGYGSRQRRASHPPLLVGRGYPCMCFAAASTAWTTRAAIHNQQMLLSNLLRAA